MATFITGLAVFWNPDYVRYALGLLILCLQRSGPESLADMAHICRHYGCLHRDCNRVQWHPTYPHLHDL